MRIGGAVVVEQPDPLVLCRLELAEDLGHRRAEAGRAGKAQHVARAQRAFEQVGRAVAATVVGADHPVGGAALPQHRTQRLTQPAGSVVSHDDGGDERCGHRRGSNQGDDQRRTP
ncbi:hypothetical protein GCM10020219_024080 [Nonomuraea dietziae]